MHFESITNNRNEKIKFDQNCDHVCVISFYTNHLQVNHPKYNQRRVSGVKYLGELYNYRMLESAVVFKTLYSFITFGVVMDGKIERGDREIVKVMK